MKNKHFSWIAIALMFVALVAFSLALFKAEEGWLGFWGGIIGSAIGVLGAFLVLNEQIKEERKQNGQYQIDNTFFNLLSMHSEQINNLKEKNKFGKIYSELEINLQSAMLTSLSIYIYNNKKDIVLELNKLKHKYEDHINKNQHKIPSRHVQQFTDYWINQRKRPPFIRAINFNMANIADAIDDIFLIEDMIDDVENANIMITDNFIIKFKVLVSDMKQFKFEEKEIWKLYDSILEYKTNKFTLIDEELRKETVENVLFCHYDEVGSYFRLFHRIIKYINDNVEDLNIKNNYLGFLRANVNQNEMLVIFYNAAYTKRGSGLLNELQKTTFFGTEEDIKNNQHFDTNELFWKNDDIAIMLNQVNNMDD
ncbi:putative phage abortive infection protein [Enterococcus hirae]